MASSSGTNPNGYMVTQVLSCCEDCQASSQLTCTQDECRFLCIHMYKCDSLCYDFNNGHLCKHIHRVHSLHSHPAEKVEIDGESVIEDDVDYLSYAEPCKPPSQGIDDKSWLHFVTANLVLCRFSNETQDI